MNNPNQNLNFNPTQQNDVRPDMQGQGHVYHQQPHQDQNGHYHYHHHYHIHYYHHPYQQHQGQNWHHNQ